MLVKILRIFPSHLKISTVKNIIPISINPDPILQPTNLANSCFTVEKDQSMLLKTNGLFVKKANITAAIHETKLLKAPDIFHTFKSRKNTT